MNDKIKKRVAATIDDMSKQGMSKQEIGALLLGTAVAALVDSGIPRDHIHQLLDAILDQRATA